MKQLTKISAIQVIIFCLILITGGLFYKTTTIYKGKKFGEKQVKKLNVNTTTPDRCVKSYWINIDNEKQTSEIRSLQNLNLYGSTIFSKQLLEHKMQNLKNISDASKHKRIDKVDIQSESRAVVWATEPYWSDKKNQYQYVLTKEKNNWVIEDIFMPCFNCGGSGKNLIYESSYKLYKSYPNEYKKPKKECDICYGMGWQSICYSD